MSWPARPFVGEDLTVEVPKQAAWQAGSSLERTHLVRQELLPGNGSLIPWR